MPFPEIDPILFSVTLFGVELALRWYALAYILGLLLGWRMVVWLMRKPELWPGGKAPMRPDQPEDLLTWMIIGVVIGGRLGFVMFYQPGFYLENPWLIPRIDQGGMSFHGGFLGVVVGVLLWCRRHRLPLWQVGDAVALAAPLGILFGRLANFINGELWGRPTLASWGVVFPDPRAQICPPGWVAEVCARHPSQLYEAALEGVVLLAVMWWLALRAKALLSPGMLVGVFFVGYGAARAFVESFRQGDLQYVTALNPYGHVLRFGNTFDAFGITMGQVLSLPMIIVGIALILWSQRRAQNASA
ncbi:MAG: prolipoprotein diacylglyceryl transferase [Pseudomonadota bacterium]